MVPAGVSLWEDQALAADLTIRAIPETKVADATPLASRPGSVKKGADPAEKFEAFVLQSFIQDMMPKSAEGVFGSGLAGDFWKSMMSEKIAEQVAARGGLGISDYVREGHLPSVRP